MTPIFFPRKGRAFDAILSPQDPHSTHFGAPCKVFAVFPGETQRGMVRNGFYMVFIWLLWVLCNMTKLQTQAYQPLVSKPRCVFGVQPSLRCCKVARIQFGSDIQMSLEQHTHLNTLEHTHIHTLCNSQRIFQFSHHVYPNISGLSKHGTYPK